MLDTRDELVRECRNIEVEFKVGEAPEGVEGNIRVGSLIGDRVLQGLIRKQHGDERLKPRGGRGGRGGRGERGNRDAIKRTNKEKERDDW